MQNDPLFIYPSAVLELKEPSIKICRKTASTCFKIQYNETDAAAAADEKMLSLVPLQDVQGHIELWVIGRWRSDQLALGVS